MTIDTYLRQIDDLLTFPGTHVSDQFKNTRAAVEAIQGLLATRRITAQEALNQAVRDGNVEALPALVTTAATTLTTNVGTMTSQAADAGWEALKEHYATTAEDNYNAVRTEFNKTAAELNKTSEQVDLNLSTASDVLPLTKKAQDAWQSAHGIAKRLDDLAAILQSAATTLGVDLTAGPVLNPTDHALPLTTNPTGHRRLLWNAWDNTTGHHLGRWGSLLKLGITIEARSLEQIAATPRPRELETRLEAVDSNGIQGFRQVVVDPEDHDYEESEPSPFTGPRAHRPKVF